MYEFRGLEQRSNNSVNAYLATYREYLKYIKPNAKSTHPLFDSRHIPTPAFSVDYTGPRNDNYRVNDRTPNPVVKVPEHLSEDEIKRVLDYVIDRKDLRAEIIIRLMLQCGLRIGEVFALTSEDVQMVKESEVTHTPCRFGEEKYIPVACIRNRKDSSRDRKAKTLMNVRSRKQYETREYKTERYGYDYVVLPEDLYDLINMYIEEKHVEARQKSGERYMAKTIADKVTNSDEIDENYWIFINSIGSPLSQKSWNRYLRKIFTAVGVPVDVGRKEIGLNHRFRHSFAVYMAAYCGIDELKLSKMLRHHSIATVMTYYHMTASDQIKLKTDYAESLYAKIPSLRRDYND